MKKQNLNILDRELNINNTINMNYDNFKKLNISERNDFKCNNDNSNFNDNILKYNILNYKDNNIKFCLDNTKRKNLDISNYINNPIKVSKGFGNIDNYPLLLNGIGLSTRQDNQDKNPRNVEFNRIDNINKEFYNGNRMPNSIPCGIDTRIFNKKMI